MELKNSKGQGTFGAIPTIVITIVIAGIIVAFGARITQNVSSNLDYGNVTIQTNVSTTFVNNTATALTGLTTEYPNFEISSVSTVQNASLVVAVGNYTNNATHVNMTLICGNAAGTCDVTNPYNVTFTRAARTTAYYAATNSTAGISQLAQQLPNAGLVAGMVVIFSTLGLLLLTRGRKFF